MLSQEYNCFVGFDPEEERKDASKEPMKNIT